MPNQPVLLDITPKRAADLLANNASNRRIRPNWVHYLAAQIKRGAWQVTTDAIGVREDGALGNGQHRLLAIVAADMPAPLLFMAGLTEEAFRVLDSGIKRSAADALGITSGLASDAALIAAIIGRALSNRVPQDVIADIVAWWEPVHRVLRDNYTTNSKDNAGLANSSVRCGVGLQWAVQDDPGQDYVIEQFRSMMNGETADLSRAVALLWKRQGRARSGAGTRNERTELVTNAHRCFDPRRADIAPFVKVPSVALDDVRRKLLAVETAYVKQHAPMTKALAGLVPPPEIGNKQPAGKMRRPAARTGAQASA